VSYEIFEVRGHELRDFEVSKHELMRLEVSEHEFGSKQARYMKKHMLSTKLT
jgi:hypothetical protein